MTKKFYTSAPANYPVCEHSNCHRTVTCLHQIVYVTILENKEYIHLVNPNRCNKNETYSFYRDNNPITYTRGFTNFQKRMFLEQYLNFMNRMIGKVWSQSILERKRGEIVLSPQKQAIVQQALKQSGVTEDLKFDHYEENPNWYD